MFQASMRWASTSATAQAMACSRIRSASSTRRSAVSFLESSRPTILRFGLRMTAAATTGPNSAPRPASSSPAMRLQPSFLAGGALDAGGLAPQVAQIVEAGTAHATLADHVNRSNRGRVQRENALYTGAKTDAAHRERGAAGPAFLRDHHAFKRLDAFLDLFAFAFQQADVYAHS